MSCMTPTSTLIILDVTKTSSNNYLKFDNYSFLSKKSLLCKRWLNACIEISLYVLKKRT